MIRLAIRWSIGSPMLDARRSFATDTDGTNHIWMAGGYDGTGVIAPHGNLQLPG